MLHMWSSVMLQWLTNLRDMTIYSSLVYLMTLCQLQRPCSLNWGMAGWQWMDLLCQCDQYYVKFIQLCTQGLRQPMNHHIHVCTESACNLWKNQHTNIKTLHGTHHCVLKHPATSNTNLVTTSTTNKWLMISIVLVYMYRIIMIYSTSYCHLTNLWIHGMQ